MNVFILSDDWMYMAQMQKQLRVLTIDTKSATK